MLSDGLGLRVGWRRVKGRAGNWYVFVLSLGELLTLKTMCLYNLVKNGLLLCKQNLRLDQQEYYTMWGILQFFRIQPH